MKNLLLFIAFFGFIALNNAGFAQSDSIRYKVTKNDGTQYVGVLIKNNAKVVILITKSLGKVTIPKHAIKSIEQLESSDHQEERVNGGRNLLPSIYSITTNAFPIRKKEGYLKIMPVGFEFQFALTDNWSLGGMTAWWGVPMIIATKYSFEISDKCRTSAGLLYGNLMYISNSFGGGGTFSAGGGIAFGNLTFGDEESNFNVSGGYGFVHAGIGGFDLAFSGTDLEVIEGQAAGMFSVAGMHRISQEAILIFDSIGLVYDARIYFGINPAIRYMPKSSEIWQFGIGIIGISDKIVRVPVPMVSFTKVFIK
ncbi:MAG: hypothetical protein GQ574_00685 [Crocinitomix sp.]|nr:hypothetical protein [Crocinitomix sp.]